MAGRRRRVGGGGGGGWIAQTSPPPRFSNLTIIKYPQKSGRVNFSIQQKTDPKTYHISDPIKLFVSVRKIKVALYMFDLLTDKV